MRTSMKKKQGFRGSLERGQQNFETQKMENKIRKLQIKRNVASSREIF